MTVSTRLASVLARAVASGDCLVYGSNPQRYPSVWDGGKRFHAHRLVWILTNGEISPGLEVCHRCDTPACVNVAHLFLGTHKDNMADAGRKGRIRFWHPERKRPTGQRRGIKNSGDSFKRYRPDVVRAVRAEFAKGGVSRAEVARRLNVGSDFVGRVVANRTRTHVT